MKADWVRVTPELASDWLKKSKINRALRETQLIVYCEALRRGGFAPGDSAICFTSGGELINGHHRLNAIVRTGIPAMIIVSRGMPEESKGAIDCGIQRNINDQLRMFRTIDNVTRRTSTLKICLYLLCNRDVKIVGLDSYDRWVRPFRGGIDWVIRSFTSTEGAAFTAPLVGALAFAHRLDPEAIEAFGQSVCEGVGLRKNSPELALRNLAAKGKGERSHCTQRWSLARKTLNAALAAIEGRELIRVADGQLGLAHFSKAYDTKSIEQLAEAWVQSEDAA